MLTQKQTSTALFTLCLGTFLALLGCSVTTSFIIAFIIGIILLGISYLKKSLISATTVIDTDSNCAVTVKRTEQKPVIPEASFLGKASVTPLKNCTPSAVTPNVQDVKQVLNFTKSANSTITTPVKQLNNSVIRLKNSHYGASAWPLNSTPIEKKPALVEQNYHMNMMKAINNVQQASPYSVKRSAVDKECSPPVVSQHKKPKTLPLLKEGRSLRHVPTVYVVHKKAENILKNKGNKRVLENTENVDVDSKRRNKEDGEIEKPQKRKLLSIVHITGKKHKVPSINSPTKYSRNTDLVVTNDDLKEDRRRNEERVRKLLAHKDDENTKPSIKPAKEVPTSTANINSTASNKAEVSKTVTLPPSDKENTAPVPATATLATAPAIVELNTQTPAVDTPKSLPKPSALDAPISTDSKVVKSLFGSSGTSENDPKPGFTFDAATVKAEPSAAQPATNTTEVKPTLNFGGASEKLNSLSSKGDESSKTTSAITFGGLTSSSAPSLDAGAAKPSFSFGGLSSSTASTTPSFSFGGSSTASVNPAPSLAVTSQNPTATSAAPSFSFGGSAATTLSAPQPASQLSEPKPPSFAAALSAPTASSSGPETKPAFSFGSAAASTAPSTGFSFGTKTNSTVPSSGSTTASAAPAASSAPSSGFSFGSSATTAPSQPAAGNSAVSSASKGFSFGSLNPSTSTTANTAASVAGSTSASAPSTGFTFGSAAATSTSSTPSAGFSFGASTSSAAAPSVFGATSNTSSTAAPSVFGAASSASSTAAPSVFGATSSTSTTPSTGFSFGSATTSAAAPPASTTGFSFGSSAPAASAPAASAPAFGTTTSSSNSTGFSFGKSASAASSTTPAFGASTATSNSGFSFGSAAPSAAPAFGAAPSASTSGSVFGSSSSAATFGSSAPPAFGAASNSAAPAFGASTASSVFGAGATSTTSSAGVFGTPSSSAAPGFNFGGQSNPTPPAPASSGFNFKGATTSTPAPATGFSFGSSAPAPAPTGGFNFGGSGATSSAPPAGSPTPANLFSNPATTSTRRIATPRRRKPR